MMNPMDRGKYTYSRFMQPDESSRRRQVADSSSELSGKQADIGKAQIPHLQRPEQKTAELEQVCTEFASIFFQTLLKSMYSTIPKTSFCPELQGKNLVNSVVDQGVAQFMAQDGAGLKELLLGKLMNDNYHD